MLMAAVMVLSMAACGGDTAEETPEGGDAQTETNESNTNTKAIPIKIAHYYADTHPLNTVLNEVFKPMIEEGTEGRYVVEVYPNNTLGAEASSPRAPEWAPSPWPA